MAGFFGLFNYDKEGPGIYKDGPKKKTFIVFFETFFRNFWKFIPVNFIYILLCLPLFTNGLANVGITHVARNTARDKHSFGLSDFFETIKKNFKQSLIAGIINVVIYGFLIFDVVFFYDNIVQNNSKWATFGLGIIFAMLFTFTLLNFFLWTLIITFNFSLKDAYKNSFKFVFVNIKYNLICFIIKALIVAVNIGVLFITGGYWGMALIIEIALFILIYPSFNALLIQYCTFPAIKKFIIDPYYKEHPEADIEKRRSLGIEIEQPSKSECETNDDQDDDDSDVIFED